MSVRVAAAWWALWLVACSQSASGTNGAGDGGVPSDAASNSTQSSGADPKIDFCTVLTKPLAAQIMASPVKDAAPRSGDLKSCHYDRDAAGGLEAAQSIEGSYVYYTNAADGRRAFDAAYGHNASEKPVSGVGDVCYVVEGTVAGMPSLSLNAYRGNYYVSMGAVGATTAAAIEGAKAIFAALPP